MTKLENWSSEWQVNLAQHFPDTDTQPSDSSARQARAHRILDAAEVLILRWGYDKTNIQDIAQQAGVGKGTIYLHWKTRDLLFRALINRERLKLAADFKQRVSADPAGATLYGIYKHYGRALIQRPLLKAMTLSDPQVLGKFAQGEHRSQAFIARIAGFKVYLEFLRKQGLVRTDVSLSEQVYMVSAIFMGFYSVAPLMPDALTLTDEALADLMAATVERALGSGRTPSADELRLISQLFLEQLTSGIALYEAQFRQELGA